MKFVKDKKRYLIARYIILDTIQVACSIYHKKLTKIQYKKLFDDEFWKLFEAIKEESHLDKLEMEIIKRKIFEVHAATSYFRGGEVDNVKAHYNGRSENLQDFIDDFFEQSSFTDRLPFWTRH